MTLTPGNHEEEEDYGIESYEEEKQPGTEYKKKKPDTLTGKIKHRYHPLKERYTISTSAIFEALGKRTAETQNSKLGWLHPIVHHRKGLLDTYTWMIQGAKNADDLIKMLSAEGRERKLPSKHEGNLGSEHEGNLGSEHEGKFEGTKAGFRKLVSLYQEKKLVKNVDLGRDIEIDDESLHNPSLERLSLAGVITKAVCIEYKRDEKTMNYTELLSCFEAALLPYYVPFEEKYMTNIHNLVLLLHNMLQSQQEITPAQRPNKDTILKLIDPEQVVILDKYFLDFFKY